MSTAPDDIARLVRQFAEHREAYRRGDYNETQLRRDFLDPFFAALGWDVHNVQGYAEAYRDVIHEDALRVEKTVKAPDYCFRIGGVRKFFVEAKRPSVDVRHDATAAFQLRRYAWTAKLPLSILSDFEELAVYDCRVKPDKLDKASTARILLFSYTEYVDRWEEIADIFSRKAILRGAFDRYAESTKKKRGTAEVDDAFLAEIESWRESLAKNLSLRNADLSDRDLNFAVQRIIDRIIFLRMCEGRGIEHFGQLQAILNGPNAYRRLVELFHRADEKCNSGLFHFQHEKGREEPDELTTRLVVDDKTLKEILVRLYYPESPYEFAALPADILGQVYEQFLGKVIRLTAGHRAKIEEKPEVRKAGGVYYTPTYIVDYIVQNTVGKLVEGRSPQEVAGLTDAFKPSKTRRPLAVLDPACGSGSFLIVAYQFLLDWYLKQYTEHDDPERHARGAEPRIYAVTRSNEAQPSDEAQRGANPPSPFGRGVGGEGVGVQGIGSEGGEHSPKPALPPDLLAFARQLRKKSTDAEKLLWALLRNRRVGRFKFRRQHPEPPYVLDFYCHEAKLAIELDGGQHNEPSARQKDLGRSALLAERGIRVLRFWNHDVLADTDAVLEAIWNVLHVETRTSAPTLTPNPSPAGRGEPDWRLTTSERKRILLAHIYGVDIDYQAVEVTKLSLLLKVLEGETEATLQRQHRLFHKERALPDLADNIKCGNSLVGPDFYQGRQLSLLPEEDRLRINVFDWQAEFPHILPSPAGRGAGGEGTSGFDAVIGNPPYVRQEGVSTFKDYLARRYVAFHGLADLYVYFLERGLSLLRDGGLLGIICSGKFIHAGYGQAVRRHLAASRVAEVLDYGDMQLFRGATTYPVILTVEKNSPSDGMTLLYSRASPQSGLLPRDIRATGHDVPLTALLSPEWLLVPPTEHLLLERMATAPSLSSLVGPAQLGIKTSLNEVFVIGPDVAQELLDADSRSADVLRPFTRGRDIKKWHTETNGAFLICTRESIDIEQYPSIKSYLLKFDRKLRARYEVRRGDYDWWVIRQVAHTDIFEHPKIIYPDLASAPEFAINYDGSYPSNTAFCIATDNLALLAFLNSRLAWFWITRHCPANRGGAYRLFNQYINKLPVKCETLAHGGLRGLAQQEIDLSKARDRAKTAHDRTVIQRQIDATDREIDRLVYELYSLSDDEIRLVEEATVP